MALSTGDRLGPYEITGELGAGGMGVVLRARDTKLDREVALKVLPEAFSTDPERLARFEREARVLASLNHPNIASIYGLEDADGQMALVLELVEGPTLADRIAEGPIPVDEALPLARQIAEALEAAHEQGVIHRDLKPANIKLRPDGTVKVLDFGLAKALSPDDPTGAAGASMSPTISLTAAATQMGMVIGTAAYMAPEQAKGQPVDKRADIWAYGAVLFEMLTGKKLFETSDVSEMLASVLVKDPDISGISTDVPAHVRSVVRHCLVKDPKERLRDIGDVRLAMTGVFESGTPAIEAAVAASAPAVPLQVWQRPLPALSVVIAAIAATAATLWMATLPPSPLVSRFEIPLSAGESLSGMARGIVALSPDGRHLAYVTADGLSVRSLDQPTALPLQNVQSAREPFFSPDGDWLGFWQGGVLRRIPITGGSPVTITDETAPFGATWTADDSIFYGRGTGGISRVSASGGAPEVVIAADEGEQVHGPQLLPDGDHLLFTVRDINDPSWDTATIVAESLSTGERVVLIEGGRDGRYVETGHLLYTFEETVLGVAFDVDALQVLGGPVSLVEGVSSSRGQTGATHYAVASDGSLVYIQSSTRENRLVWVDREGQSTPVDAPTAEYGRVRFSPDGARLVMLERRDGTSISVRDLVRGSQTPLTPGSAPGNWPEWTPDGERIVWNDGRGLVWQLADGTGEPERLAEGQLLIPYAWADEGRTLVANESSATTDIFLIDVEGDGTIEPLLSSGFAESRPSISPDGRWLAHFSNESTPVQVYVRPFPNVEDARHLVSVDGGISPVWSADGTEIFYRNGDAILSVPIETEPEFRAGSPTVLFRGSYAGGFGGPEGRMWDYDPVGDRFVMVEQSVGGTDAFQIVQNWFQELTERVPVP